MDFGFRNVDFGFRNVRFGCWNLGIGVLEWIDFQIIEAIHPFQKFKMPNRQIFLRFWMKIFNFGIHCNSFRNPKSEIRNPNDFGIQISDFRMYYVDYQHIPQSAIHNPQSEIHNNF